MRIVSRLVDAALEAAAGWVANRSDGDTGDEDDDDRRTRSFTNHAGGYYVCGHTGCRRKVDPFITGHDCCGRCSAGRVCKRESMAKYDGPGAFAHRASPPSPAAIQIGTATPGICTVCDEPLEDHPDY